MCRPQAVRKVSSLMSPTRGISAFILVAAILVLAGCWSLPGSHALNSNRQSRTVSPAVLVESVTCISIVKSVDFGARTITLLDAGDRLWVTYSVDSGVSNLGDFKRGDHVEATLAKRITLGRGTPHDDREASLAPPNDARVLLLDRSYRLLTLRRANGVIETVKISLRTNLSEIEPGEAVTKEVVNVTALRLKKRSAASGENR